MLRTTYLVSVERFTQPSISPISAAQTKAPLPKKKKKRQKQKKREHPYEKWVNYLKKIREADIKRKTQTQAIAEFLKNLGRRRRRRRHYLLQQLLRLPKRSFKRLRHIDLFPNSKKMTTMMMKIILPRKIYKFLAERT